MVVLTQQTKPINIQNKMRKWHDVSLRYNNNERFKYILYKTGGTIRYQNKLFFSFNSKKYKSKKLHTSIMIKMF